MPGRGRLAAWILPPAGIVAAIAVAVVVTGGAGGGHRAGGAPRSVPSAASTPATTEPSPTTTTEPSPTTTTEFSTTTTTTLPAATTTTLALPPAGNGALPQTRAFPSVRSAAFSGEMVRLMAAIRSAKPSEAEAAFFPLAAYEQVKALSDDAADWRDRLLAHFRLDVAAAHAVVGPAAVLVRVVVPTQYARWIPPGACANRLGYWNVPGSRLVYRAAGDVRSIGIASLISWRGYWYVVHLGSEVPPAGRGVVDAPAAGVGVPGPPGGC